MRKTGNHWRRLAIAATAVAVLAAATPIAAAATSARDQRVQGPVVARAEVRSRAVSQRGATLWRRPAGSVRRVVLVGDSLAQEVTPFVQFLTPGKPLIPKFWGGTAPCDWLNVDLQASRSSVVAITFTGNSLTPCMTGPDGVQLRGEALVEKYSRDILVLVDRARRSGARVVLVGQPYRAPGFDADLEVEGINQIYRTIAATLPFVSFIDAGAAVETPDGHFTDRLPCLPFDSDCAEDGTTLVRGDGVHFCPIVGENPCSIWSSGAFRFGSAIAAAVNDPRRYD